MQSITNFIKKLALHERSVNKLALSFCIGNYIAFSPYIGLHTAMIFLFTWIMRLNLAVTFATAYVINNPFTMVAVYLADYVFGYWLLYTVLGLNFDYLNPAWLTHLSTYLYVKLGFELPCLWSFLIGGNLLGILTSIILYPIMKIVFSKIVKEDKSLPSP